MAVDEALLESAVHGGPCTLRWYRWEQATLSIGYFQVGDGALNDPRFSTLPVVRRLSGGGALIHDREWTYSCTLPASHPLARDARQLYVLVHEAIIEALAGLGFSARMRGTSDASRGHAFLCFSRGDDFDVMMGDHKILGSAQRRRKGAVLQHGGLILQASQKAPEFPGIFDCAGRSVPDEFLIARLCATVGSRLAAHVEPAAMQPDERRRALEICPRPASDSV